MENEKGPPVGLGNKAKILPGLRLRLAPQGFFKGGNDMSLPLWLVAIGIVWYAIQEYPPRFGHAPKEVPKAEEVPAQVQAPPTDARIDEILAEIKLMKESDNRGQMVSAIDGLAKKFDAIDLEVKVLKESDRKKPIIVKNDVHMPERMKVETVGVTQVEIKNSVPVHTEPGKPLKAMTREVLPKVLYKKKPKSADSDVPSTDRAKLIGEAKNILPIDRWQPE